MTAGNGAAPLGEAEYAELVNRIHATVAASIPPGSTVLVVSKGDAALLEIPGLSAAHFPQDQAGDYAGHHPRDSAAAIAELERLRRHGAEYLVIPATARWWLDFYADFAGHLASHDEVVADVPDACLIYGLGRLGEDAAIGPAITKPTASVDQLRDYLERLISTDSNVVLLDDTEGAVAALEPLRALQLAPGEVGSEGGEDLLVALRRRAEAGADYLVVPRSSDEWLDRNAGPTTDLEAACRKIADQRHLCRVFELEELREGRGR
jgi:hypothetical protein